MEAYLNDITLPQAEWKVSVNCRHTFSVGCTLSGSDRTISVKDILVATGQYLFENVYDGDSDLPFTIRLTELGKALMREVAEEARRQLERVAAA